MAVKLCDLSPNIYGLHLHPFWTKYNVLAIKNLIVVVGTMLQWLHYLFREQFYSPGF